MLVHMGRARLATLQFTRFPVAEEAERGIVCILCASRRGNDRLGEAILKDIHANESFLLFWKAGRIRERTTEEEC